VKAFPAGVEIVGIPFDHAPVGIPGDHAVCLVNQRSSLLSLSSQKKVAGTPSLPATFHISGELRRGLQCVLAIEELLAAALAVESAGKKPGSRGSDHHVACPSIHRDHGRRGEPSPISLYRAEVVFER